MMSSPYLTLQYARVSINGALSSTNTLSFSDKPTPQNTSYSTMRQASDYAATLSKGTLRTQGIRELYSREGRTETLREECHSQGNRLYSSPYHHIPCILNPMIVSLITVCSSVCIYDKPASQLYPVHFSRLFH